MANIMVRILMAKLGDGYDKAMLQLGKVFRDAGFEVIYTNAQKPEVIVASALQESVDHIGITTLPGANINDLGVITETLARGNASDITVTAGGFIEEEDKSRIKELGVIEFFPKGTTLDELVEWAIKNIKTT